ncbi:MAG TPA: AMP-binding protein [Chryseolinea sp.]|nr:AMP-binding protein [Chryseolinea sp.]HPM28924.1 AMP-binding protein [Chryseolinea sp.]
MSTASSPLEKFFHWEKTVPQNIFFRQPINGEWKNWTYQQAGKEIRILAGALSTFPPKSKVAILSKNCAHWIMADLAIMMAGHISVPLYANSSAASIKQILEHSESAAIFVGKLDDYDVQKKGIPDSVQKISASIYGIHEGLLWEEVVDTHAAMPHAVERSAEELLTIMYTSGTTGIPKGVMFNSNAFDHTTDILIRYLRTWETLPDHPRLFSYLPLCHIAERNLTEMLACYTGATISFVESLETFGRDLASVQPDLFFGVPRIWAKFQEKVLEKMPQKKLDTLLKIPIINSIVKKSITKKLGLSKAGLKGTAAAPIPVSLLEWFDSLGIRLREIYGMTENCALSHSNQKVIRFGTVGNAMETVEVKFSEDHEILTRHVALMMGYYKEPAMTAEVMTADGYLRTGDQGAVDAEGFLTITGRVKDLFKTDKGKYISPAPIEMKLMKNSNIEQVCVVGMGIPQPIALVNLSAAGKSKSKEEIVQSLTASLEEINPSLEHYEHLKKIVVMKDEWNINNGLMTPTMKVKRNEVEKIHLPKYPGWYAQSAVVVWE